PSGCRLGESACRDLRLGGAHDRAPVEALGGIVAGSALAAIAEASQYAHDISAEQTGIGAGLIRQVGEVLQLADVVADHAQAGGEVLAQLQRAAVLADE